MPPAQSCTSSGRKKPPRPLHNCCHLQGAGGLALLLLLVAEPAALGNAVPAPPAGERPGPGSQSGDGKLHDSQWRPPSGGHVAAHHQAGRTPRVGGGRAARAAEPQAAAKPSALLLLQPGCLSAAPMAAIAPPLSVEAAPAGEVDSGYSSKSIGSGEAGLHEWLLAIIDSSNAQTGGTASTAQPAVTNTCEGCGCSAPCGANDGGGGSGTSSRRLAQQRVSAGAPSAAVGLGGNPNNAQFDNYLSKVGAMGEVLRGRGGEPRAMESERPVYACSWPIFCPGTMMTTQATALPQYT